MESMRMRYTTKKFDDLELHPHTVKVPKRLASRLIGHTSLRIVTVLIVLYTLFDLVAHNPNIGYPPVNSCIADHDGSAAIGKMTMLYGRTNPLYERALETHRVHNAVFGYPFFILREEILPGFWSKPAYMLRLLLAELEKPEPQRLSWLVWVDADTVIMNPNIALETFLPPADNDAWSRVHALVTNDERGLNNGVFFLRVHEWSVLLMNTCLNTQISEPDLFLEFDDQSALEYWLLESDMFRNRTIHVPQRWFNAYTGYRGSSSQGFSDPLKPSDKYSPNAIKEGDLLVHLAGHKRLRAQMMLPWVEAAERRLPMWELELERTNYTHEIEDFWNNIAAHERQLAEELRAKARDRREKVAPAEPVS